VCASDAQRKKERKKERKKGALSDRHPFLHLCGQRSSAIFSSSPQPRKEETWRKEPFSTARVAERRRKSLAGAEAEWPSSKDAFLFFLFF